MDAPEPEGGPCLPYTDGRGRRRGLMVIESTPYEDGAGALLDLWQRAQNEALIRDLRASLIYKKPPLTPAQRREERQAAKRAARIRRHQQRGRPLFDAYNRPYPY